MLSTPSLGITNEYVVKIDASELQTFNSLSRDHAIDPEEVHEARIRESFNSLSRDHSRSSRA
jgi:hypothetical protein